MTPLGSLLPEQRLLAGLFVITAMITLATGEALVLRDNRTADGSPWLSARDLQLRFTGNASSLFEARVRDDMRQYLADGTELSQVLAWVNSGAGRERYTRDVAALLEERCARCHRLGGRASFRPLQTYEEVKATVDSAAAPSLSHQLLVTKVHLGGLGILLGATAALFSRTTLPSRSKALLICGSFAGLFLDFGSWWLMRVDLGFAWGRVGSNLLLLVCFTIMCVASLWELAFAPRSGRETS